LIPSLHTTLSSIRDATAKRMLVDAGPIVVRPDDATPMVHVTRTLFSAASAGIAALLAARDGTEWRLLRSVELPSLPGVVGGARGPIMTMIDVTITRDGVRLTSSGTERKLVGHDTIAIEQALTELRAARTGVSVRIEAIDDVVYRRFVQVVDAAHRAGLEWQLRDHARLVQP
jgi:hypothetical protein